MPITSEPTPPQSSPPQPALERTGSTRTLRELLSDNGPLIAAGGVAVMFCGIIFSLFLPFMFGAKEGTTLLRELATFEVARGLITFLVAVATVGIALILTVFVVATRDPAAEKMFALGKEVLTGLIGILGTIVGFYFGSGAALAPSQLPPTTTISIKELKAQPPEVKPGGRFTVSASITGTSGEFDYIISFKPNNVIKNIAGKSEKPEISTDITVPASTPLGTLEFSLQLIDKKSGAPLNLAGDNKSTVKIIQ